MNSCAKGKRAEREAASLIRELFGTEAKRSQQHCGIAGDADLSEDSIPGFHVEVKHYARIASLAFLDQATADSKGGTPIVMMRQNGEKRWAVMMWVEDFAALVKDCKR